MSSIPLQNPAICRLCGGVGHRTSQCPEMSDPEEGSSFLEVNPLTEENLRQKMQEEEIHLSEVRERGRKDPPRAMDVEAAPQTVENQGKGRGKGPQHRAKAAMTPLPKATSPPQPSRRTMARGSMDDYMLEDEKIAVTEIKDLTFEELQMVHKRRQKAEVAAQKKVETAALTGWGAKYPSLSNVWSDDLAFNILASMRSRMRTYLWKKLVWQLRIREAVHQESRGRAQWKRNTKWLNYLLSYEVAAMWGHFGAMRQRLRSSDFVGPRYGEERTPNEG